MDPHCLERSRIASNYTRLRRGGSCAPRLKEGRIVSRHAIGMVIDRLLTDENPPDSICPRLDRDS